MSCYPCRCIGCVDVMWSIFFVLRSNPILSIRSEGWESEAYKCMSVCLEKRSEWKGARAESIRCLFRDRVVGVIVNSCSRRSINSFVPYSIIWNMKYELRTKNELNGSKTEYTFVMNEWQPPPLSTTKHTHRFWVTKGQKERTDERTDITSPVFFFMLLSALFIDFFLLLLLLLLHLIVPLIFILHHSLLFFLVLPIVCNYFFSWLPVLTHPPSPHPHHVFFFLFSSFPSLTLIDNNWLLSSLPLPFSFFC